MKSKIFIGIIAMATLMSCNSRNNESNEEEQEEKGPAGVVILNEKQRQALDLKLGTFQWRNLTTLVKTNGQLQVHPSYSAEVTAIIGGNIKEIKVFHGDKVKKGQVLAILEHPDYISLQEDFAALANKLEYLEQEYERQKELFENNVGAGKDYQLVKSEYNTAKARLQGLESRLQMLNIPTEKVKHGEISNTVKITSPINGFINEIDVKLGTYVGAKDMMFEITDNDHIHADFMVYEKDVHLLKEGQKVDFTVSNLPGEELSSTVFAIGKEFEANTRAVHIHANLDEMQPGLIPGMYISGHIHTDDNYTLSLPENAVVKEGTKSFIFIIDDMALEEFNEENSREVKEEGEPEENSDDEKIMAFRMIEVVTGRTDGGHIEIKLLDSLPENTQIVMNAAYYLLSDLNKGETGDDD